MMWQPLDIGKFVQGHAGQPKLFMALAGIFIGLFIVPFFVRIAKFKGDKSSYRERQREIFDDHKGNFHNILNRSYNAWLKEHKRKADDLNALVDRSGSFNKSDFLSCDISKIENALINSNVTLWDLCSDIVKEIEKSKKTTNYKTKLLSEKDCEVFSIARRKMKDFWALEAERIYAGSGLIFSCVWLAAIDKDLKDRSLTIIPFIETALAKENNIKKFGSKYLLKLCLRDN